MSIQTTIDQVSVSARLRVVDNMQVAWPNPVDLDNHCTEIITTHRPGDDPRTLEFSLELLTAMCREHAQQYPEVRIAIDLIPLALCDTERCCQKRTVISSVEQGAQLTVTFGTNYADAPVGRDEAIAFANDLVDRIHKRMHV